MELTASRSIRARVLEGRPPLTIWLYLLGTAVLVGLSFLPSQVETTFTWEGAMLECALLAGLFIGISPCRMALIVLGLVAALGGILIQSSPLDAVATIRSVVALLVTGLLLSPSARSFCRHGRVVARSEPVRS